MDVNDLKSLFAEVNKRMDAALEHVRHELAGVRTGRASVTILDSVHVEAYGSRMPLNQVAGLSVPEPTLIVAQPFDPVAARRHREGDPPVGSRPQPVERRQGRPHPDSGADRRAPQGAVAARPQAGRRRAQPRAPGAPRRERSAEEAAQGSQDLRRRREEGPRRGAEADRRPHQPIDDLQKKKDPDCWEIEQVKRDRGREN